LRFCAAAVTAALATAALATAEPAAAAAAGVLLADQLLLQDALGALLLARACCAHATTLLLTLLLPAQPAFILPLTAPVTVFSSTTTSVPVELGPGIMPWAAPDGATSSAKFVVTETFIVKKRVPGMRGRVMHVCMR
jgi:hypothetical protein